MLKRAWWHTLLIPHTEAKAGRFLRFRTAWFTDQVLGQPGLHSETLSGGGAGTTKTSKIPRRPGATDHTVGRSKERRLKLTLTSGAPEEI